VAIRGYGVNRLISATLIVVMTLGGGCLGEAPVQGEPAEETTGEAAQEFEPFTLFVLAASFGVALAAALVATGHAKATPAGAPDPFWSRPGPSQRPTPEGHAVPL
jgi:hypothetical protein